MLSLFGDSQQKLLRLLLGSSHGATIDQIANDLGISRNAVTQHLASLGQEGFVEAKAIRETAGRPSRTYSLTAKGTDLFPKQYPWFSSLILKAIKAERGSDGLVVFLKDMARTLALDVKKNFKGQTLEAKIPEAVAVMHSLSYEAVATRERDETASGIEAANCVYHHLAKEYPEVCQFDLELLKQLLDSKVNHEQCILRNNGKCRFTFTPMG